MQPRRQTKTQQVDYLRTIASKASSSSKTHIDHYPPTPGLRGEVLAAFREIYDGYWCVKSGQTVAGHPVVRSHSL
jgi:hypothetical protein